jgi:hypothetical protein
LPVAAYAVLFPLREMVRLVPFLLALVVRRFTFAYAVARGSGVLGVVADESEGVVGVGSPG